MATQLPNKADITGAGVMQGGVKTALNQWIDHSSEVDNQVKAITGKASWDLAPIMSIEAIKTALDSLQAQIVTSGGDAPPGTANYIADGLTLKTEGLNVKVQPGRAVISEKTQKLTTETVVALQPRSANLLYGKFNANGPMTVGAVQAVYPEPDDNTVAQWRFNLNGDQPIPNYAVGRSAIAVPNNLINNGGLARIDGWCDYGVKGDGVGGYYVSQNYTGFPIGAAERQLTLLFTVNELNSPLIDYGTIANNQDLYVYTNGSGIVSINTFGTDYVSNFVVEMGKAYLLDTVIVGGMLQILVNGTGVYSTAATLSTAASVLKVGKSSTTYSKNTFHFLEIRNKARTAEQIAQISNKLCLPCSYTKSSAAYPTIAASDFAAGAHEWRFDEVTGNTVADTNALTPLPGTVSGTTIVDSPIGHGKARKLSSTSDKIALGNYDFGTSFTIVFAGKINGVNAFDPIVANRNSGGTSGLSFEIATDSGNVIGFGYPGSQSKTPITLGANNFIVASVNNNAITYYINSASPDSYATLTTNNSGVNPLYVGYNATVPGRYCNMVIDELLIVPRALTTAEIAQCYNSLMGTGKRDIREVIPVDAISIGFARTSSNAILEIVDSSNPSSSVPDWMYGIRSGLAGVKNRRKFLGWQYFNTSGTTPQFKTWPNPFGTRRINQVGKWAIDTSGNNESAVAAYHIDSTSSYGALPTGATTATVGIHVGAKGATWFNNVWQTSGYLGVYAEVLDNE